MGFTEGDLLGLAEGFIEGFSDGDSLGLAEGFTEGESLGLALGSDEGNELGLWVARTTPSIERPGLSRSLLLSSNCLRSCVGLTDSPVLIISTMMFTTVVEEVSNLPSLSSEVTGDISLTVSNGYRNLLSEGTDVHPGVHVPEPSTTVTNTLVSASKISPTSVRNASS